MKEFELFDQSHDSEHDSTNYDSCFEDLNPGKSDVNIDVKEGDTEMTEIDPALEVNGNDDEISKVEESGSNNDTDRSENIGNPFKG